MKEQLEFKHVSPYLPYGLKIVNSRSGNVRTLEALSFNHKLYLFKPILRPLSDLEKEIEHNGEKFVPIKVLEKEYSGFFFAYNSSLLIKSKNTNLYISTFWINEINNKLYEWHFAINIPEHLYIDINTLKTE